MPYGFNDDKSKYDLTNIIDDTLDSTSTNAIQNKAVTTAINTKANKYSTATATMLASGWSSGVYSFESSYPVATYDIEIEPNGDSCTAAQLKAWSSAQIVGSATTNTCKALGTVPTVNIPIIIKVVKK